MGPPQYKIVWGCMGAQENRLGEKIDWKTVDSICSCCWFEVLVIRHADMDPNSNLCMTHVIPASPRLKLNQMCPDRDAVNATLSKIWPQLSLQPIQTLDASDLNLTGRGGGRGKRCSQMPTWPWPSSTLGYV